METQPRHVMLSRILANSENQLRDAKDTRYWKTKTIREMHMRNSGVNDIAQAERDLQVVFDEILTLELLIEKVREELNIEMRKELDV